MFIFTESIKKSKNIYLIKQNIFVDKNNFLIKQTKINILN